MPVFYFSFVLDEDLVEDVEYLLHQIQSNLPIDESVFEIEILSLSIFDFPIDQLLLLFQAVLIVKIIMMFLYL